MKRLLVLACSTVLVSAAYSHTGTGEYRFGPDVSENLACDLALQRATDDLLIKYSGELVDHVIEQRCVNNDCLFNRQTFSKSEGIVQNIQEQSRSVRTELGQRVCTVTATGTVKKVRSDLDFSIHGNFTFRHNERFNFTVVPNKPNGDFYVFNLYNDRYRKVYSAKGSQAFREVSIPTKGRLVAKLPEGQDVSHETLLFLYVTKEVPVGDYYTLNEMNLFLMSLDPSTKRAYRRFLTIRK